MKIKEGKIIVVDDEIRIELVDDACCGTATYSEVTIENLMDAARVLASWMDIPHDNAPDECKRIHRQEQLGALIRDHLNKVDDDEEA